MCIKMITILFRHVIFGNRVTLLQKLELPNFKTRNIKVSLDEIKIGNHRNFIKRRY